MSPRTLKMIRVALILELLGILSIVISLVAFGPPSFVVQVMIGLPLMGLGMAIYLWHRLRGFEPKKVVEAASPEG